MKTVPHPSKVKEDNSIKHVLPWMFCGVCDKEKLEKIEHNLTERDIESYNKLGWEYYHPNDLIEYLLPELGKDSYFKERYPVVEIKGKKYKVQFESDYRREPWDQKGQTLTLIETDEPLSELIKYYSSVKFFGQPRFVQGKHYPLDLMGNPCHHLMTIENGWGDSGNYNILIGFDKNNIPNMAYFEASCC